MNLIDRHVLREWLKTFGLVLMATLGLLLIHMMADEFTDLVELSADAGDMIMYFAIKVPSFLAVLVPIILLVSLLYALGHLHRNNEFTAMRAAGLGVFTITRSVWLMGGALCVLMWSLNASIVPWSVEASRSLKESLEYRYETGRTISRVVTFDNQRQGRMWFINRYSRYTGRAYGVTVSELDSQRREKIRMHAAEARFDRERGCWVFRDGRETWFDPETNDRIRSVPFDERVIPYYTEEPQLMLVFDLDPQDLSFFELRRIIDYFTIEENPKATLYAVRYFGLVADTLAPLVMIALAIPFVMTGVRVNPAVGVSKALGLFAIYFILLKFAHALGVRGTIDPVTAACAPSLAMLAVGAWFFTRMR